MRLSITTVILLACVSSAVPRTASADGPDKTIPLAKDVSLRTDGVLVGYVVNSQGEAMPETKVTIYHGRDVIAEATSDRQGTFYVRKLRGGVHQVVAGQSATTVRLWTTSAAPPASRASLTVVARDNDVVRGQFGENGISGLLGGLYSPCGLLTAGLIAGGIIWAVEEADDDDDPPASA